VIPGIDFVIRSLILPSESEILASAVSLVSNVPQEKINGCSSLQRKKLLCRYMWYHLQKQISLI
jgi:hypothetical protein